MDGTQNLWILKPANQSRGRGIKVASSFQEILNSITIYYPKSYVDLLRGNALLFSN